MGSGRGTTSSASRGSSRGSRVPVGAGRPANSADARNGDGASAGPSSVSSEDARAAVGGVAGVPVQHMRVRSIGGGRDGPSSTDSSHGGDASAQSLSLKPRHRRRGSRESLGGDSLASEDTHTVRSGFYLPPPPSLPRRWTRGDGLGAGSFGSVYLGLNADTGELFAVKEVEVMDDSEKAREAVAQLEREVRLLTKLQHPNIVRYIGTARDDARLLNEGDERRDDDEDRKIGASSLFIFLEYVPGGSIAGLLERFGPLETSVVSVYASQILVGLDYLHAQRVAHRDVKGANILVEKSGRVKLADFGMAKTLVERVSASGRHAERVPSRDADDTDEVSAGRPGDRPTEPSTDRPGSFLAASDRQASTGSHGGASGGGTGDMAGSAFWMAPEVVRRRKDIGAEADIWSMGCVVLEMFTGEPPWSECGGQAQAIYKIASTKELPAFPEPFDDLAEDFVRMCLRRDPGERPSAAELLTHPFVAEAGGAAGDVPALRYEYEGYWSGEDDAERASENAGDPALDDATREVKKKTVGGDDRDETKKNGSPRAKEKERSAEGEDASPRRATRRASPSSPAMEDWRVEVEAMRRRFAEDSLDGDSDEGDGAETRAAPIAGARAPSGAMPRPPTLAGRR